MYTIVSGGSGHQNSVSLETLRLCDLDVTKLLGQMICRNSPPKIQTEQRNEEHNWHCFEQLYQKKAKVSKVYKVMVGM